jgi:hypothetical protein
MAVTAMAQTTLPTLSQPQFILSGGLGFNHYETPQIKGQLSFATRVADGLYNISTLNTTSKVSTLSTGIAKRFHVGEGFALSALVDGGIATGGGNVGGAVSGGGILTYDVSKWSKVSGSFAYGAVQIAQTSLGGVQPTFSFGVGKVF